MDFIEIDVPLLFKEGWHALRDGVVFSFKEGGVDSAESRRQGGFQQ